MSKLEKNYAFGTYSKNSQLGLHTAKLSNTKAIGKYLLQLPGRVSFLIWKQNLLIYV